MAAQGVKLGIRIAVAAAALLAVYFGVGAKKSAAPEDATYDIVIANGNVMDPESGLDAVRNVGISGGQIRAISSEALKGKQTIDAKGLVVAPGFIDLHEHGQEPRNYQFQARDGVTTSLELEAGTADVDSWYAAREGKSLINYGVSIGHIPVRTKVLTKISSDSGLGGKLSPADMAAQDAAAHRQATPEELVQMKEAMEQGIQEGCQTFDQALFAMYRDGIIVLDQALINADSANNLRLKIKLAGLKVDQEPVPAQAPGQDASRQEPVQAAVGFRLRKN